MSPLPIVLACGPYDRTRALADGRVTVAGADPRYICLDPEEIFFRMVTFGYRSRCLSSARSTSER